jgi:hypothetical protein
MGASGGASSKPDADSVKSADPEEGGEVAKPSRSNGGRSRSTSSTTAASEAGV